MTLCSFVAEHTFSHHFEPKMNYFLVSSLGCFFFYNKVRYIMLRLSAKVSFSRTICLKNLPCYVMIKEKLARTNMTTIEKWNLIISHVQKKLSAKETEVQQLWENIFADANLFGYSKFSGEIDGQRNIHIGSSARTIPDIIIRDIPNNKDLFAVELKQHNLSFDSNFKLQLFSYMKLLRLNVGVLICNKIYLYVLNDDDSEMSMEIPFLPNSADGEGFLELFIKGNFDIDKVKDFIKSHEKKIQRIAQIKKEAQSLKLEDLLIEHFSPNYSVDEIKQAISVVNVPTHLTQNSLTHAKPSTTVITHAVNPAPTKAKPIYNDDFTFTDEKDKIDGIIGYKAYNASKENIGIIFMDNDKRLNSYQCCSLHIYPSFRSRYGSWHIIKHNGRYVKWVDFCNQLQVNGKVTIHID